MAPPRARLVRLCLQFRPMSPGVDRARRAATVYPGTGHDANCNHRYGASLRKLVKSKLDHLLACVGTRVLTIPQSRKLLSTPGTLAVRLPRQHHYRP